MPKLRAIVALGRIAHESTLKALGLRNAAAPFAHGAVHKAGAFRLYDSYHCSRYNTNTRVLTPEMFRNVFAKVRKDLDVAVGWAKRSVPTIDAEIGWWARFALPTLRIKPDFPSATPARRRHSGPAETPDRTRA